ncbi:MAG: aldo/keto reductase [Proteobacteria bacterium]|nr:aldo/keto reductase [Pseudomonadota bacterium]MCP4917974.1 aldo/keto reductase [Pseudomonadota bacterium]
MTGGTAPERLLFGAWSIGGWFWADEDLDASRAALRAWVDGGMTWVDTAPIYGFGLSEKIVGEIAQHLHIATKCGLRWEDPSPTRGRDPGVRRDLSAASIRQECEDSLRRLGVEHIDLYQCHWPDEHTPLDETMDTLVRLVDEGHIGAIGVSNFPVELLEETRSALGGRLYSTQPRFSALDRGIERDILPWCRQNGVRALVYSPLEHGLLTGKVDPEREFPVGDRRRTLDSFSRANRARVKQALQTLQPLAKEHGTTVSGLVLAWTLTRPGVTSAIVGARTHRHSEQNAQAARLHLCETDKIRVSGALAMCHRTQ